MMDGILAVDKPRGWTSHDVVDFMRQRFGLKKVGHAGTLDPMATGVLVMLIGSYTRSSAVFSQDDKEYEATLLLGAESDTGDAEGNIAPSGKTVNFSDEEISAAFDKFVGPIDQKPPMYSAVKVKGRKLYEYARLGIKVDRKPKRITIKELKISGVRLPEVYFKVKCSKGTYVRQLAADIGKTLGCGAYLAALKRTASGRFEVEAAMNMEELKRLSRQDLEKRLVRI